MDDIKEYFSYDKESGKLFRTKPKWGSKIGEVTTVNGSGYIVFKHNQKQYYAHRIAWWFENGYMPSTVDHINRDRKDNRICNLREVTHEENMNNRKIDKRNMSGHTGVTWQKYSKGWIVHYKKKYLGWFKDINDAIECRSKFERKDTK